MMAELLAPAGSLDTVLAAIDAGTDAIYLGGKVFNARKFAHNLDDDAKPSKRPTYLACVYM